MSLRYKWTILAAFLCSLMIALLWSAGISTVFPVVKIVLEGETAQSWVASEIANAETQYDVVLDEIDELKAELAEAPDETTATTLQNKITLKVDRLEGEKAAIESFKKYQPWVEKYAPQTGFQTLVWAMVFLLVTSIIKGVLLVISSVLCARVANRTVMDLRRIYYRKALMLDQKRIDRMGTSSMMTHLSHNMLLVSSGLRMFYGKCFREPLKMIVCLSVAAYISLPLLLLSLIVVPAGALVIQGLSRRMKSATQSEMQGMADVFQTLIETFKAIKTVRIFNRETTERRRFKENAGTLYKMSLRISMFDSMLRPISEILGIIAIAMSLLAGAYLVLNRETHLFGFIQISQRPIDASMFVLFYTMLGGASDPARKMSEIVNVLVRGGSACENLFNAYDIESEIRTPENPVPVPEHSKSLALEKVLFAYQPGQPVLRNVSLEIPFGQTVAIVGGNGSGKSTLVNLLTRFYDPNRGRILLDGIDLKKMNPRKLRRQISWVTQGAVLFEGTIRENIAYADPNATEEQIQRAAALARVDEFAKEFEHGFDSDVGDDGRLLSAGQRQRVALARAVLADPKILILDEATSQMDGRTETLVHNSLRKFIRNRTTIIITHRASSLELAERVLVMRNGRIVSDSTVAEAETSSPVFQTLFAGSQPRKTA
ncbi:MAG: ABC transporter ATP-binding protein [Planctomycetota bacterium]